MPHSAPHTRGAKRGREHDTLCTAQHGASKSARLEPDVTVVHANTPIACDFTAHTAAAHTMTWLACGHVLHAAALKMVFTDAAKRGLVMRCPVCDAEEQDVHAAVQAVCTPAHMLLPDALAFGLRAEAVHLAGIEAHASLLHAAQVGVTRVALASVCSSAALEQCAVVMQRLVCLVDVHARDVVLARAQSFSDAADVVRRGKRLEGRVLAQWLVDVPTSKACTAMFWLLNGANEREVCDAATHIVRTAQSPRALHAHPAFASDMLQLLLSLVDADARAQAASDGARGALAKVCFRWCVHVMGDEPSHALNVPLMRFSRNTWSAHPSCRVFKRRLSQWVALAQEYIAATAARCAPQSTASECA